MNLLFDLVILHFGIYPKDSSYYRNTCTSMFVAALFTIPKRWKQPSTDKWIMKMWYIYTMEVYSSIKKDEVMKCAGKWMELETVMLSEVTQTQKNK